VARFARPLNSILDMRQLDEYKRNVTASGAANIMALFRFTGIHVCIEQGYSLKVSILNFLSSSGAPCACPEMVGKQAVTQYHNIEYQRGGKLISKKQSKTISMSRTEVPGPEQLHLTKREITHPTILPHLHHHRPTPATTKMVRLDGR
jgi:hypothetical protein